MGSLDVVIMENAHSTTLAFAKKDTLVTCAMKHVSN